MGMDPAVSALLWGLGSAMSLPLGAGVAIMPWIPDPSERVIGLMMSFGAGALLFAVSVEMFSEALREEEEDLVDGRDIMWTTVLFSLVGALFYIFLNRQLTGGQHKPGVSLVSHWRRLGVQRFMKHKHVNETIRPLVLSWLEKHTEGTLDNPTNPRWTDWSTYEYDEEDLPMIKKKLTALVETWDTNHDGMMSLHEIDKVLLQASYNAGDDTSKPLGTITAGDIVKVENVHTAGLGVTIGGHVSNLEFVDAICEMFDNDKVADAINNSPLEGTESAAKTSITPKNNSGNPKAITNPIYADDEEGDAGGTFEDASPRSEDEDGVVMASPQVQAHVVIADSINTIEEKSGEAAFSIWLGIAIDGVPESMMIGFMAANNAMSIAFIVSVFLANFPEALSSSTVMKNRGDSYTKIMSMWGALCIMTGTIACITALSSPSTSNGSYGRKIFSAGAEGLAGGSMMACVSTAMLPEGFSQGGDMAGLATMVGFLASLLAKVFFETSDKIHEVCPNHTAISFIGH